jgi:nucleotide-binding universal stress UspA family protein
MNLLLAVDDSYYSEIAVREVAERPWPQPTTVRVLSVAVFLGAPVPGVPSGGALLDTPPVTAMFDARNQLLETTNLLVQRAADRLARDELRIDTLVREGDPGAEIIAEAEAWPADLIIIGSHGHRGLKRLLLGSVAQHVLNHAPCSVQIARVRGAVEPH